MQIDSLGDSLYVMSKHITWEKRKIFQNVVCWNFYPACLLFKVDTWATLDVTKTQDRGGFRGGSTRPFNYLWMCIKLLDESLTVQTMIFRRVLPESDFGLDCLLRPVFPNTLGYIV